MTFRLADALSSSELRLRPSQRGQPAGPGAGSHAIYVSQPAVVADLIVRAAKGTEAMAHVD